MSQLVVIVGITGNQGGSVANVFLQDSNWRIRGLSRDVDSKASKALRAQGVEMVTADLHSQNSLLPAFKGANLIFSVTDFWKPFFNPAIIALAEDKGISIGQLCYNLEYEQGKNIADAAAHPHVLATLNATGLIASTLSCARECSQGKYKQLYHFDSKANIFPKYIEETHPELAMKTSYMQTGYFMSSWNFMPHLWPGKRREGSGEKFIARMATAPDAVQPHVDVNADTGYWPEWMKKWAKTMQIEENDVGYEHISVDEAAALMGGDFGREVAEMYEYSSWPGYDGGMPMLKGDDLRKARIPPPSSRSGLNKTDMRLQMGFNIPTTTIEEYTKKTDWSRAMNM